MLTVFCNFFFKGMGALACLGGRKHPFIVLMTVQPYYHFESNV